MPEACDHYGTDVMDETFDMWYNREAKFVCMLAVRSRIARSGQYTCTMDPVVSYDHAGLF